MDVYDALKFVHVLTAVAMAAPLYTLILVNERARFGKAHVQVDRYLEGIIRGNSRRCYAFQLTALVSGVLLAVWNGPATALVTNPVLAAKLAILLALLVSLSVVHFSIQPVIDRLLDQASGETIAEPVAAAIAPLRRRRKRMAGVCLFLVIVSVLLGLQVYSPASIATTALLLAVAAAFAWRAYRSRLPYGWT